MNQWSIYDSNMEMYQMESEYLETESTPISIKSLEMEFSLEYEIEYSYHDSYGKTVGKVYMKITSGFNIILKSIIKHYIYRNKHKYHVYTI